MNAELPNLSARESLDIIAAMIREAKGNIQRNNFYFLFWGWLVVIANLGMYTLQRIGYEYFYAIWLITLPAWAFTLYKLRAQSRSNAARSHFDRITGTLWISFGVAIFSLVVFGRLINYQLNPVILIMSAIPTVVSGVILRFRPLVIGGVTCWITGMLCFLVDTQTQPLIGAVAIIIGFLIPGYMLRSHKT